jgi:hypothetical protein
LAALFLRTLIEEDEGGADDADDMADFLRSKGSTTDTTEACDIN